MHHSDPMAGRSRLLRIGVGGTGARRPFLRRLLILVAILGPLLALSVAVGTRALPMDGLGRVAYLAHDRLFLPIKAHLWTRIYPFGFAWLVPLAILSTVALLEWLSPASAIRGLHRRGVLRASRGGFTQAVLLAANGAMRRIGMRPGFAAAVVEEALIDTRAGMLEDLRERHTADRSRSAGLARLWLRLAPDSDRAIAAAQEVVALSLLADSLARPPRPLGPTAPPRRDLLAALADAAPDQPALPEIAPGPGGTLQVTGFATSTEAQETAEAILLPLPHEEDLPAARALVPLILSAGLAAALSGAGRGLPVFDLWARLRLSAGPDLSSLMAEAETLVQFGFWARLAEPDAPRLPAGDLLAEALEAEARHQPLGEGYAERGQRA